MTMHEIAEMCRYDTSMGDGTMTIGITRKARQAITDLCREKGMTKRAMTERVIGWFAKQDTTLQAVVLGHLNSRDEMGIIEIMYRRQAEVRAAQDRARKAVARTKAEAQAQARKQESPGKDQKAEGGRK